MYTTQTVGFSESFVHSLSALHSVFYQVLLQLNGETHTAPPQQTLYYAKFTILPATEKQHKHPTIPASIK